LALWHFGRQATDSDILTNIEKTNRAIEEVKIIGTD
jgi:hypothetical protein